MIRFGVAGFPPAFSESKYGKKREQIFLWLKDLGLEALELQMTYGPRMKLETCITYKELSEETGVKLSIHASYFIVLTSNNREKIDRSIDTLKKTYDLSHLLGSQAVILHPGPLYKDDPNDVMSRFIDNAGRFILEYGKTEVGLYIETAGKLGQLGSVSEILDISRQLEGVYPCIDFGHIHARTLGGLEEEGEIHKLVDGIVEFLSKEKDAKIHFHYTPIHYGPRGEIQHRSIDDRYPKLDQLDLFGASKIGVGSSDGYYHPRVAPVANALRKINIDATVISETHNSQERGALALKKHFREFAL